MRRPRDAARSPTTSSWPTAADEVVVASRRGGRRARERARLSRDRAPRAARGASTPTRSGARSARARAWPRPLRPDRRDDAAARDALIAEGRAARSSSHPHIVRGYELHHRAAAVVVMETLDGETVAHLVERTPGGLRRPTRWRGSGSTSPRRCSYLHGRGLLHLDVKPANVIADGGRAKLIDLSLARPPGRYEPGWARGATSRRSRRAARSSAPAADVWGARHGALRGGHRRGRGGLPAVRPRAGPGAAGQAIDACLAPDPAHRPDLSDLCAA